MIGGTRAVSGLFGLGWSLALAGCFTANNVWPTVPRLPPPPTAAAPPNSATDLRLPDAVASGDKEIPLVPVPPPPLGRPPRPRKTPAGPAPVTQTANPPPPSAPAAPAPAPLPPAVTTTPADNALTPRQLYQQAAERYAVMDSYIARLTRREQFHGKAQPEEVLLFKFRKEPWSVYFKWLGAAGHGREVVYVKGRYEDKIHTLLAAGDHPLMGAGKRLSLPVDSIFVRSASRHPITEAGIGASIERLGRLLDALDRGDKSRGTLAALEAQNRPEFPHPVHAIEQVIPAGKEPELPRGGRRLYCFDPQSHLPVLVSTRDDHGQEVEYYFFDRLQFPVKLDDDDFNPDKLWPKPGTRPGRSSP